MATTRFGNGVTADASTRPDVPTVRTLVMFVPYIVIGLVHVVAQWVEASVGGDAALTADAIARFTKPLLLPVLLAGVLFALPKWRSQIALLAGLGMLFSWAGDVALMYSGETSFLVGLGAFLLANVAYIVLFARKLRSRRMPVWSALYAIWWLGLVLLLAPHTGSLLIPVAAYGLVLGTMAVLGTACNAWIAVGGALFVLSDSILGINKFLPGLELSHASFLIMLSYILAQGFIGFGVVRTAWVQERAEYAQS